MAAKGITISWAHQKFAQVFAQTGDRSLAATEAGSKAKDRYIAGTVLLQRTGVRSELERLRNIADTAIVQSTAETKSEVLSLTREAIDLARVGVPVVGKNGSAIHDELGAIVRRSDTTGMLKGAELLGKTVAMFTDRHQTGDGLEDKSDKELALMIEAFLTSSPVVLEQVARMDAVREKVHANDRTERASPGVGGEAEAQADGLFSTPEAAGPSPRRLN
jgi:hypothetical protein